MRTIIIAILLTALAPFSAGAEEIIKKDELLTLERCTEIAVKKHPAILAARHTVSANQSRVGQAEADHYPQIDLSAGYSRISSQSTASGRTSGSEASNGSFDQYSGSITLRQNIYDFGKTSTQVDIRTLNTTSSQSDLENVTEQVIFGVKQSYYGLLKARRNREVAEEAIKQFRQHLEQAKGFYEVGTKPKFDVTKAEVDLSNATLERIRADNALRLSVVSLNNAMGVPDAPEFVIEDNLSFQRYEMGFSEAVEKAFNNRPDLKSLISGRMALERSLDLSKKGYYPVLTGNAAYSRLGDNFPLEEGWNVGLTLTVPLFNGYLTKNQIEEAKANLGVIKANEEALRHSILLEVQQAYLNLNEAGDRIVTAELTVKLAEENFEIANGRYAAGVGNPIEVTDAEVTLSNARTAFNQALYDYKIAQASLQKAMGIRI
ncbi:MAG: TolC family protein [Nitrospirae bacterium]|nr:TolC family protein [Nitrospirota bacterium]